jgi:hypothetical protein
MASSTWPLTDLKPISEEGTLQVTSADVAGTPANWFVRKRTLRGGLSEGVEVIDIHNGRMKLVVLVSRGLGIWRAEVDKEVLGWQAPVRGPVHPRFVPLTEPRGAGWLEGFDELMVRCGLESNGSAVFDEQGRLLHPLHGRIANRPAHSLSITVDDAAGTISLHGIVDEIRFHSQKLQLTSRLTTSFDSTSFEWDDQVENVGGTDATMQMLYHINVGSPLLEPGAQISAPVRTVVPHDQRAAATGTENYNVFPKVNNNAPCQQSYFLELLSATDGSTQTLLKNRDGSKGMTLRFNKQELPWFTIWRNNVSAADGYVASLEPATNFPNPRPFEESRNRVVRLAPAELWKSSVAVDWHLDRNGVVLSEMEIDKLQAGIQPEIWPQPRADWSAAAG